MFAQGHTPKIDRHSAPKYHPAASESSTIVRPNRGGVMFAQGHIPKIDRHSAPKYRPAAPQSSTIVRPNRGRVMFAQGHTPKIDRHSAASHSLPGIELFDEDLHTLFSHPSGTRMPSRCLPAVSSHSLGRSCAGHDLITRLQAAASHNIFGIELFYDDLDAVASLLPGGPTTANIISAAHHIRDMTNALSLTTMVLQPFRNYEGLTSRTAHTAAIEKAKLWFQLARTLGTDLILVPSNFLPASECTSNMTTIIRDMTELADLGAQENPPICFAYENLSWGTHIDTWEGVHSVVMAVDRWNFGYCLDTFNIAGRVYGDPTSADGKTDDAEVAMTKSLTKMVECVDREKLFYIQVVDAERVLPPLTAEHAWYDARQPARMSWSRNARLFPFEEERGGYLPVVEVCTALFTGLGYRGWVSFELFSRTLAETGKEVPEQHAARVERSWRKLVAAFPEILSGDSMKRGAVPKKRQTISRLEKL